MCDISFKNVSFYRDSRCIYDDITFTIPTNKITTILGPSGAGKTTILQLIAGLIKPTLGKICIDNAIIEKNTKETQLEKLRRRMGFLFQSGALFTHLSVYDNIAFPLRKNTNLDEKLIRNIVLLKLQAVGLAHTINMMPSELSGGMARRVALARSIAMDPDIMMYDEPFTGQDPASFNKLLELISTLNESLNMTSIIVSHDIQESLSISDHIIIVGNNKIIASDSPENIKNSKDQQIQNFLAGKPLDYNYHNHNDLEKNFFKKEILGR
ncbi:ABC transporter ATP-binding protein [Francisella tularensis]|uniref:ABC transporter ATP-binding protein n=1 Tax=Francisella tularensis TaxID=263 RepID=UPI000173E314|nr:ABC transporter ATP-binding protein [Francisella tularensis]ACD30367.1 ABC transporter, ATP-binding protein [Francisella tularensis subsp. mediasiatica FSC147]MBK2077707.1 ABC transporter ATP-binding protein [Francisella tularensis subsp. mediasiatica]MBK2101608.1 ABC transporter ATP-binding protein [Francisella tularensis subsp. mediasiatica]MBK2105069.1 ABC transporter ATP-binding protein [Francisella tularensis subsp. mediasiatica]MDN9002696.1 ABC transporter ATP-binding protein [Francis